MERRGMVALAVGGLASLLFGTFAVGTKGSSRLLRPPGALPEPEFLATCLRCGKCAQVCPQRAVKIGLGDKGLAIGTPYIVPREAACDLCLECIPVCSSGALRPVEKSAVRMGCAQIDQKTCLAWLGDECKICYTSCPFYNKAITLADHKHPVVNAEVCGGCGICERVCITEPASIIVAAKRA